MMIFVLILGAVVSMAALILGVRLARAIQHYRIRYNYTATTQAPSVSVCIPARNEMHVMTECLERVLASDYPKLEVIVYDDSSADETSTLVRSFAHAGVRFVPGSDLPEGWLGKNHALDVLRKEASGTFVIFMDVDTYIRPTTISWLVGYTLTEGTTMTSVIPRRNDVGRISVLFGSLRYFWQLVLNSATHPATASSLWLIKREVLTDVLGGFVPFRNDVQPEASIARKLGHQYRCLISTETLGVSYEKKWRSQLESSRRLLFPVFGGSVWGAMRGLGLLLLLNTPTIISVSSLFTGWTSIHTMASFQLVAFTILYGIYLRHAWARHWWLGMLLWPVVVMQELSFFIASIYGYASGTITWKGRPVRIRR